MKVADISVEVSWLQPAGDTSGASRNICFKLDERVRAPSAVLKLTPDAALAFLGKFQTSAATAHSVAHT